MHEIKTSFIFIVIIIIGFISIAMYTMYTAAPANNQISNVIVIDDPDSNYIEWEQDGKRTTINKTAISRIERSDKSYSYYSYWKEKYTLYLTEHDYAKIHDND